MRLLDDNAGVLEPPSGRARNPCHLGVDRRDAEIG
jgi:hypothetical protein